MAQLVILDVAEKVLRRLQQRASAHGRTAEAEARAILEEALQTGTSGAWAEVDAIYHRLAASGRTFCDSAELLREDRDR